MSDKSKPDKDVIPEKKKTLEEDGVPDDDDADPSEDEEEADEEKYKGSRTPNKRRKLVPSANDSRKRARKASCWKWFRDSEVYPWYSVCQVPDPVTGVICGKQIACGPKSTTSGMNKHLRQHKKVLAEFLRLKAQEEVQNVIDTLESVRRRERPSSCHAWQVTKQQEGPRHEDHHSVLQEQAEHDSLQHPVCCTEKDRPRHHDSARQAVAPIFHCGPPGFQKVFM